MIPFKYCWLVEKSPIIVYWVPTAHWSRSFHLAIWIAKSALWVWVKAIQSLFYHILRGMLCYYGIKKDFNRRVAGFYMTLITHSHFVLMDHQTQQWNMAMAHPPFLIFFGVFPIGTPFHTLPHCTKVQLNDPADFVQNLPHGSHLSHFIGAFRQRDGHGEPT